MRAAAVEEELARQGLAGGAILFTGTRFPDAVVAGWAASLWPIEAVARSHRRALAALERSRARLPRLARGDALVESFLVGGAAIRSLARDPLLPEALAPAGDRRALTGAMRDYDRRGRAIWNQVFDRPALDATPGHLAAMAAAP